MGRLYPFADQVIVTSAGVADDMAAYTGLARDLIRVVPSPVVPESLFTTDLPRPDHPWLGDPAAPLILSAGELCDRKGFDTLLRAFARVRAKRPCRLMILGQGGERDALLALAAELGVAARLCPAGLCTRALCLHGPRGPLRLHLALGGAGVRADRGPGGGHPGGRDRLPERAPGGPA